MSTINDQITNACKPLMDNEMLKALAMSKASETSVVESDKIPEVDVTKDILSNLPVDLDTAIERIRALETALDDLNRASEIAQYSGQFEVMSSFRAVADDMLLTKIEIIHDTPIEMNITIVTNEKQDAA